MLDSIYPMTLKLLKIIFAISTIFMCSALDKSVLQCIKKYFVIFLNQNMLWVHNRTISIKMVLLSTHYIP